MTSPDCVKSSEGVHGIGTADGEFTLCGDVWEGDPDIGLEACKPVKSQLLTCPRCISVVNNCKPYRTGRPATPDQPKAEGGGESG